MSAADAKLLLRMKLLKVSGDSVRRGGAQSTIWMRMIIGQVVFSQNMDLEGRNEATMAWYERARGRMRLRGVVCSVWS